MTYVKDDGVYDDGMNALLKLLAVLDQRHAEIRDEMAAIPYENPLWEEADDLAGLGFVACQRYLTQVTAKFAIDRPTAFSMGPRTATGEPVAFLVDTAANAWKHEAEWRSFVETGERDEHGLTAVKLVTAPDTKQQQGTFARLRASTSPGGWDYKFANALHLIAADMRFVTVADLLVAWREAIRASATAQ